MDLQEAIERFLSDAERRRSDVTVRRFREAMELLQTFLAVHLLDPESTDPSPPDQLEDLTPAVLGAFLNDFLGERLKGNDRARRRYGAATRAFVQWLARGQLLPPTLAVEILDLLRQQRSDLDGAGVEGTQLGPSGNSDSTLAGVVAMPGLSGPEEGQEHFFQVVEMRRDRLLLLDVETALEVQGENPAGEQVEPGDLVAGVLGRRRGKLWVSQVRPVTDEDELDELDRDGAWDEDLMDEEDPWDEPVPLVEDALEILASEDRYAPREVVRVILSSMDEARDDLLDWLQDDDYRNEPLPGAGEAPANAARLLSEVRDLDAVPRLLDVLGDTDPLGEEAPAALGRYGQVLLVPLEETLRNQGNSPARRAAAAWALGHMAARNPALRPQVCGLLLSVLLDSPGLLVAEVLGVMEDLRAVEVLDQVLAMGAEARLDFEAHDHTAELFQSRVTEAGWGERLVEALLPVIYLYPSNEELEEFYGSLEEDLGDLWDLMDQEADEEEDEEAERSGTEDGPDDPSEGGKVIPFRRPVQ